MNHERVITEEDLRTRFHNERDVVTLSPYRVGDRVVRCASCRTIVKSEFVSGGCPVCGHTPFLPAPVEIVARKQRSLGWFLCLLLLSAGAAMLPFGIPSMTETIEKAMLGVSLQRCMLYVGIVSLIAAVITYNNRECRRTWQNRKRGRAILLIPAGAPYLILAAVWALILILTIGLAIAGFVFVICFLAALVD